MRGEGGGDCFHLCDDQVMYSCTDDKFHALKKCDIFFRRSFA